MCLWTSLASSDGLRPAPLIVWLIGAQGIENEGAITTSCLRQTRFYRLTKWSSREVEGHAAETGGGALLAYPCSNGGVKSWRA